MSGSNCDHCGKSISLTNNAEYAAWCKECALGDMQLLEDADIPHFTEAEFDLMSGDSCHWSISADKVRAIPKKTTTMNISNITCDHCGKTLTFSISLKSLISLIDTVAWCNDCIGANKEAVKSIVSLIVLGDHGYADKGEPGDFWSGQDRIAKLRAIPKKTTETTNMNAPNATCDHCGKRLYMPVGNNELVWCKDCSIEDIKLFGYIPHLLPTQFLYEGQWFSNDQDEVRLIPKKAILPPSAKEQTIQTKDKPMALTDRIACYCCGTDTKNYGELYANTCGSCSLFIKKDLNVFAKYKMTESSVEDGFNFSDLTFTDSVAKCKAQFEKKSSPIFTMIKSDATNAGYRIAAHQMTKGVKSAILMLLKDKGMEGGKIAAISEMLESEMGSGIIAAMLGFGLAYVPGLDTDPRVQHLAKEFRIEGIATAGNTVMELAFTHLMPVVSEIMESLPALPDLPTKEEPNGPITTAATSLPASHSF